ncbi:hypothetical protein M231_06266 [Tremella mesenterica]|uniref:Ketoreductase (KR) domain-containing protein n=1 Tax=Tremella mesenterica TaxID=5217 RepID=A0A4Q1BCC3_TREME|nr:uncharacterized protein TREMEDRAFT_72315 [Tremella mesenterica DSM 1558]EIW66663.1 hypothetical protein TREMEDRAFT_72315 [Tremella mesenterica DSM 1558]RXK36482.1 hypothetical protein M231_06266 [Tremella mesenterica]
MTEISLRGQNKTAVFLGGTQGMGAACARLLAKLGCSDIVLVGRSEIKGEEQVKKILEINNEVKVVFVKADMGTLKGMRTAAEDIISVVEKIDYLVMTQGGTPSMTHLENEDGNDPGFSVQGISRFVLPYLLIKSSALNPGATILSICNVGQTLPTLTVDDLNLKQNNRGVLGFFMDESKRDSCVIDGVFLEGQIRYPEYRWVHQFPGLVRNETFDVDKFPFPINWVFWMALPFSPNPDGFAPNPINLLLDKDKYTDHFYNRKNKVIQPGDWAKNGDNRKALWEKLVGMV